MADERHILLIDERADQLWRQVLTEALAPWGTLHFSDAREALSLVSHQDYALVIIDASEVENVSLLVTQIRVRRPASRIVVASTTPTWRRAREALRSGATDYIRKSLDKETMVTTLLAIMAKTPPPHP